MQNKGFTLIEVLLSISAIAIIAGISIPVYQSIQNRNDLDIAATTIAQSLRRAQVLSRSVDSDTTSGVYVQSGSVTIFHGASYATRDTTVDEIFQISPTITLGGVSQIVFSKMTGLPTSTGTITLTSITNETRNITINSKGMVNY